MTGGEGPLVPPKLNVVVPFTRLWVVDSFLAMFDQIDFGSPKEVNVLFYNDTDDRELTTRLVAWAKANEVKFGRTRVFTSGLPKLDEWGSYEHIVKRRERIIAMRKTCAELLLDYVEYSFFLEDDTFVDRDAFQRLFSSIKDNPEVGLVSGVEANRHAFPCLGLWHIEPLEDPQVVKTAQYRTGGIQELDGTGMYCFITRTALYKAADFRYESECLGPDNCFGWDLRKQGLKVLVDWRVICAHKTELGDPLYPGPDAQQIVWRKEGEDWAVQY